jgi:hypothetical protein
MEPAGVLAAHQTRDVSPASSCSKYRLTGERMAQLASKPAFNMQQEHPDTSRRSLLLLESSVIHVI